MSAMFLRPISWDDAGEFQRLAADPDVCLPANYPCPFPADGAREFIAERLQAAADGWAITFAVVAGGVFVGSCSLYSVDLVEGGAELGFWIGRPYWGRGHATAAVGRLIAVGFGDLGLHAVTARCLGANERAKAVLYRHDFQFVGFGPGEGTAWRRAKVHSFALRRAAWERGEGPRPRR
jgi:8-oxo-dGTP diphosphatase